MAKIRADERAKDVRVCIHNRTENQKCRKCNEMDTKIRLTAVIVAPDVFAVTSDDFELDSLWATEKGAQKRAAYLNKIKGCSAVTLEPTRWDAAAWAVQAGN